MAKEDVIIAKCDATASEFCYKIFILKTKIVIEGIHLTSILIP